MTTRILAGALVLSALLGFGARAEPNTTCERIVTLGDLHGGIDSALTMLERTGLIDDAGRWIGGDNCLVQLGDMVDRGPRSREVLDLFMDLSQQAPGRVYVLLGNHEVMNLTGDLRYVAPEEFGAYRDLVPPGARERLYREVVAAGLVETMGSEERRAWFEKKFPPGWIGHRAAFAPEGPYGVWLLERPAVLLLDDALFLHGGFEPDRRWNDVDRLNREALEQLAQFIEDREELIELGWFERWTSYGNAMRAVEARWQAESSAIEGRPPEALAIARRFLEFPISGWLGSSDGPLWSRALAQAGEVAIEPSVRELQQRIGVRRIVVGHTPQAGGRMRARLDGRVFLADTGAGPAYDGSPSALELYPDGVAYAAYPAKRELLWAPAADDAAVERYLERARIVEVEDIGVGVTKPKRVKLDLDGDMRYAAYKYVEISEQGVKRMGSGRRVMNFSDSYRYERAAYVLDRELGLGMVPVAIEREVRGDPGVLIEWVEGARSAEDEYSGEISAPDAIAYDRQHDLRRLFDALIRNTDRNMGNMLIRTRDWKLYLIDHSRSFRYETELLPSFTNRPARLTRELHERLKQLDEKRLSKLLRGLVSRARIKPMIKRRDAILEKIEEDRAKHGDGVVFYDPLPTEERPQATPATISALRAPVQAD